MRQINILYVITKLELGGAQKQLLSLISNLDQEKFKPFLFSAKYGLLLQDALSINGLTIKRSRFLERSINPLKDALALLEICVFIKKNRIDIVHTHSSKAGILGRFAARLAKAGVILHTVHGWSFNDYQPRLLRKVYVLLERISSKFSDAIIAVSEHDKQKGLHNRIGNEHQYKLIRYGINTADFCVKENHLREELGLTKNDLVVGMVSCFKPQKSPQDFIKLAFSLKYPLPNVKFILIGDGILRKKIETLISKMNLNKQVILTGWRRDIPALLSVLDVFALTSLWEGLPVSVLEAMAASKAVVATDTGGISEIINQNRNGYLVSSGSTDEMRDKIISLLSDVELRNRLGQNARNSLSQVFSAGKMSILNQQLYSDLFLQKEATRENQRFLCE